MCVFLVFHFLFLDVFVFHVFDLFFVQHKRSETAREVSAVNGFIQKTKRTARPPPPRPPNHPLPIPAPCPGPGWAGVVCGGAVEGGGDEGGERGRREGGVWVGGVGGD